jgi:hypothetical protein
MTQDEFYQNISDWISKDKDNWNHITLMAYFCHKYEKKHNVKFRLVKWSSDPGKGKESRDFSRLMKLFLPENFDDLSSLEKKRLKSNVIKKIYNYINWMFDYKFRSGDKSVTGTNIFLLPSMINEFERMYSSFIEKESKKDNFSIFISLIKEKYSKIFECHQIDDIHDLKILNNYCINYKLKDDSIEMLVINEAIKMGILK